MATEADSKGTAGDGRISDAAPGSSALPHVVAPSHPTRRPRRESLTRTPIYTSRTLQGQTLASASNTERGSFLPERKVVRTWMVSPAGLRWELMQTVLSVVACAAYVLDTYGFRTPHVMEYVFTGLFMTDYLGRFYAAANRLLYPFGAFAIIDLLTIAPVLVTPFLEEESLSRGLSFLRFVRVLRVMRVLRSFGAVNSSIDAVGRGLTMLLLTVASIMFLSAGLIHLAEGDTPECEDTVEHECFTFGLAMYFIVITVSTVGYGDVYPVTDEGRAIVAGMIVFSLIVLPGQIDELAKLVAMRSRFKKAVKVDPHAPHVLVIGSVASATVMEDLLKAFFHPDRLQGLDDMSHHRRMVIMGVNEPSAELQTLLVDTRFETRVQYVVGAVTSNDDLRRAGAHAAEACMVLTDPHALDPLEADKATLLRTLLIKNFRPRLQTLVHILDPGFDSILRQTAASVHDKVVCVDSMKAQLIAQSAMCPGFSTLVLNLVRMSKDAPVAEDASTRWLEEYGAGAGREMYTVHVPKCLDGYTFTEVVTAVYQALRGQVLVWAVLDASAMTPATRRKSSVVHAQAAKNSLLASATLDDTSFDRPHEEEGESTGVLLNPGDAYRVKAGQALLISAVDQVMAHHVEEDDAFSTVKLPPRMESVSYGVQKSSVFKGSLARSNSAQMRQLHTVAKMGLIAASGRKLVQSSAAHTVVMERMNREEAKREEKRFALLQSRVMTDCSDFSDHIVITGGTFGMDQLLDLVGADSQCKVVMIHPMDSDGVAELEELVSLHECLYIVRGSAFSQAALEAAAVRRARCFVIISDRGSADDLDGDVLDSSLLFTYLSVTTYRWKHKMRPEFFVLVSTTSRINLNVLDAKARVNRTQLEASGTVSPNRSVRASKGSGLAGFVPPARATEPHSDAAEEDTAVPAEAHPDPNASLSFDDTSLFLPFFAAGYGFATSSLHTMLAAGFYDSNVFRLVMALLTPPTIKQAHVSHLTQIDVPRQFHGAEFCDAFLTMLQNDGTVTVGVYRAADTGGNPMPYVFTAPDPAARLNPGDRLFVFKTAKAAAAAAATEATSKAAAVSMLGGAGMAQRAAARKAALAAGVEEEGPSFEDMQRAFEETDDSAEIGASTFG